MQQLLTSTSYIYIEDLFRPKTLQKLIDKWTKQLNVSSPRVVASQFSKRYCSTIIIPRLKEFLLTGEAIDLPKYLQVELISNEIRIVEPSFDITSYRSSLQEYFPQLFAEHLKPLWKTIAEVTKISKNLLWENTFIYLSWLYEEVLSSNPTANVHLHYLQSTSNTMECFQLEKNPFTNLDRTSRKRCCLYFMLPEATETCKNCPIKCQKKNIRSNFCQL